MESVHVIKKLGSGMIGSAFLVEINGKRYVSKVERIPKSESECSLKNEMWREIEFSKFTKKHPEHFMQLHSWTIENECLHKPPSDKKKDMLKEANEDTVCLKLTYSPVLDFTLEEFYKKHRNQSQTNNTKRIYGMMIQVIDALDTMLKSGYLHMDVHNGNVMAKKTEQKKIPVGARKQYQIPTFQNQWYLIDYGSLTRVDWPGNKEYGKYLSPFYDITRFLWNTIESPITKKNLDGKKYENVLNFTQHIKKLRNTVEYKNEIRREVPDAVKGYPRDICIAILFLLRYPLKFHQTKGFDIKKESKYIIIYSKEMQNTYTFLVRNIENLQKCIRFLVKTYFT